MSRADKSVIVNVVLVEHTYASKRSDYVKSAVYVCDLQSMRVKGHTLANALAEDISKYNNSTGSAVRYDPDATRTSIIGKSIRADRVRLPQLYKLIALNIGRRNAENNNTR